VHGNSGGGMDAQGIFRKVWMETQFVSKRNCGGSVQTFLKIALAVLSQKWRLHYLCQKKIQEICIFQIINKIRLNKEEMGYDLETSEFLSPSLYCNVSKNT
jgi:hypothetical protein